MLKNFKPISLILLAGATCFPASIFAETMPSKQGMNISQQNGKVTGTVVDSRACCRSIGRSERNNQWKHYRHGW